MNDITALAQREKFEAWAHSQKLSLAYGDCGYVFSSTEMAWRAWRESSAGLVEALEKAQQQKESDFEIKARLCKESNGLHDRLREAEKRIAELESHTVTVKLPAACADDEYFNDGVFQPMRYERDVERALRAAGIQAIEGEGQ